MSDTVMCDVCGKLADGHGNNGFMHLSLFLLQEDKTVKRVDFDLCYEHSQQLTRMVIDWVAKKKEELNDDLRRPVQKGNGLLSQRVS